MKLELGKIFIKDIRFDDKTHVKDGVLYVSKEEVEKLVLEDDKLAGCHVDIARPGESVRITPVKDVIEPRVKAVSYTHLHVYKRQALGKDTLDRNSYYGWYGGSRIYTKKEVLSGLLKACYPAKDDTPKTLGQLLGGTKIRESRLVEVAMYAPKWIEIIEEYLGWKGLKLSLIHISGRSRTYEL